jgi:hypothetical protein
MANRVRILALELIALLTFYVEISRPWSAAERSGPNSLNERYSIAGRVVNVRDTDNGPEVSFDWGMSIVLEPEHSWSFSIWPNEALAKRYR